MDLFNQTQEQSSINKISKCINKNKVTEFDKLRLRMIKELKQA